MSVKSRLAYAVAVASLSAMALAVPAQANLVTNGSFETGDFTGWTQFGDTTATGVATGCFDLGCPTDGNHLADFGPVFGNGGIFQSLATVTGNYNVSFDLSDDSGEFFSAFLGLSNLLTLNGGPSFGTTHFSYTVGTTGPETLSFTFFNPPAWYTLDNVDVTAVSATPLPSTWLMLLSGFVGLGCFAFRGKKKSIAALSAA
jgi:hypothetical protein